MGRPRAVAWEDGQVLVLDQRRLPQQIVINKYATVAEVARSIREMEVRGAPAIGATAAYGYALGAQNSQATTSAALLAELKEVEKTLGQTRPTAVNLFWALTRMRRRAQAEVQAGREVSAIKAVLLAEAEAIAVEDIAVNRRIGAWGATLLRDGDAVLTHCNAGALATVDYGTALGVIRAAWEEGKRIRVFVDETRPYLQGMRLTAWELLEDGIPVTLITDNMAGYVLHRGMVQAVIVGADRIAANGDVANKIGTYSVAVLARANGVPFYVAAPWSTIDLSLASGEEIPIEERAPEEVTHLAGQRLAPEGVDVFNPAFDVTPHDLVTAIITERGIIRPPYQESLARAAELGNREAANRADTDAGGGC